MHFFRCDFTPTFPAGAWRCWSRQHWPEPWAVGPRGLQDEATGGTLRPWVGCCGPGAGQRLRLLNTAAGFWQQKSKPNLEAKTRQGSTGAWRDMALARCGQGHPPSRCRQGVPLGCSQLLVVTPDSPGAARRQILPLQRSDPGHGCFSPTSLGEAAHPMLPHIGAPRGTLPPIPAPGSCSSCPQTAENLGFVCKVQSQGLAAFRINWLLTADYVFKSTLVEQQAAAGSSRQARCCCPGNGGCCLGSQRVGTGEVLP